MKQIVQDLRTGETILEEVPAPQAEEGHVLIRTCYSLVSLGTERMLVEFGRAGYIQKARQQPEKVKQVIDKIKTDGLRPTLEAVYRKLNQPLPLGYSNAGEIISVGEGVKQFTIGQRVISNGTHAEFVSIPENLVAIIPDEVSYQDACFTVVGAIGLQGIRLVNPTFGETIVVIGLGLIGIITGQLLKANGCEVIGIDVDEDKVELARKFGLHAIHNRHNDPIPEVLHITNGIGADAVIITASTKSNEVISDAARMSRKKGRIVLIGVIGLDIQRSDFYEKELTFQVSCSYGPGRYDQHYEQKGYDYPVAYVRWTEKRNFEAVLNALKNGQLNVQPLITEVKELNQYNEIYGNISDASVIASLLKYPEGQVIPLSKIKLSDPQKTLKKGSIALVGSGAFVSSTVLPHLKKLNAPISYIVSARGLTGTMLARQYNIPYSTTDYNDVLQDPGVSLVLISTRHDLHAMQVIKALESGKNVFVEKPLAILHRDLDKIQDAYTKSGSHLLVGFNRRFSPLAVKAKNELGFQPAPMNIVITVNAGNISPEHWTQDLEVGGGRIVGEACHFIDLISYLTGSMVYSVLMDGLGTHPQRNTDNANILLKYQNGSLGTIHYYSNGHKSYAKERVEIYAGGKIIIIDNFRKIMVYGKNSGSSKMVQDKGHRNQFEALLKGVTQDIWPALSYHEIMNTSRAVLCCLDSIENRSWVNVE